MNMEKDSVIVVECQPLMLIALSAALAEEGFNVLAEVEESGQAIQSVVEFKPRLIVFSVGSPSLPDLERISALRHEFPDLQILALVSGVFRGQERMALDYGAHRVLTKAARREELLSALWELSNQVAFAINKEVAKG